MVSSQSITCTSRSYQRGKKVLSPRRWVGCSSPRHGTVEWFTPCEQDACAGTLVGQELWKLVVADTFVSIAQRFVSTVFFYKLYKRRVQLEVVQSVLGLVYRQGRLSSRLGC